jgi:dephospho-CoA kinase
VLARFGTVDRKELGRVVFSDPAALGALEAITHPWLAAEIRSQVARAPGDVVINAALLHKQGLFRLCQVVVWVQAPLVTRILRARTRDGWTWSRILRRIWAQRKLGPQVFPRDVDILRVDNAGSLERARMKLEIRFPPGPAFPQKEVTREK